MDVNGGGSDWTTAAIALAGVGLGAVLGVALAELSGFLRRRRETAAAAAIVLAELGSAYAWVKAARAGEVERPEDVYIRRTAWEEHGLAIVRAISLEDSARVSLGYSALDSFDRVLHSGAPAAAYTEPDKQQWLDENVIKDVNAAMDVVVRLTSPR